MRYSAQQQQALIITVVTDDTLTTADAELLLGAAGLALGTELPDDHTPFAHKPLEDQSAEQRVAGALDYYYGGLTLPGKVADVDAAHRPEVDMIATTLPQLRAGAARCSCGRELSLRRTRRNWTFWAHRPGSRAVA